jgi:hypothetical protein
VRHHKALLALFFLAAALGTNTMAAVRCTGSEPTLTVSTAEPIAREPEATPPPALLPAPPPASPAPPPKAVSDRPLPATAGSVGKGRVLTAPAPGPKGEVVASIPALDKVLEIEEPDETWADQVLEQARNAMPANAQIEQMTVKCVQTFCRVHIVRPLDARLGWEEVDHAFNDIANGEAIFATQVDGNASTGYLYFAEAEGNLPLDMPAEGTGPWDAPTDDGV